MSSVQSDSEEKRVRESPRRFSPDPRPIPKKVKPFTKKERELNEKIKQYQTEIEECDQKLFKIRKEERARYKKLGSQQKLITSLKDNIKTANDKIVELQTKEQQLEEESKGIGKKVRVVRKKAADVKASLKKKMSSQNQNKDFVKKRKIIQNWKKCPKCEYFYDKNRFKPLVLNCGHNLCKACCYIHGNSRHGIKCEVCDEYTPLDSPGGYKNLPPCWPLLSIM